MKGLTVVFFLFTAFAIVLAHGVIPHHHHHEDDHAHSHHSNNHTHHPGNENHADHHNMYTWFIHGKKELTYSPTQLCYIAFSVKLNFQVSLADAIIKKINLPPELNIDISNIEYCSIKLLRAPPLFLA